MFICDACDKGYHSKCHDPPFKELKSHKSWICCHCSAEGYHVQTVVSDNNNGSTFHGGKKLASANIKTPSSMSSHGSNAIAGERKKLHNHSHSQSSSSLLNIKAAALLKEASFLAVELSIAQLMGFNKGDMNNKNDAIRWSIIVFQYFNVPRMQGFQRPDL